MPVPARLWRSSFEAAKKAVIAMLDARAPRAERDRIKDLDQLAANEVDRAVVEREKRKWLAG